MGSITQTQVLKIMKRLFVFDMDGTLLPQTTAILEIAGMTGHKEELERLEKQLINKEITNDQFAKMIYDLWDTLAEETVKASFAKAPKMKNIDQALNKIVSKGGIPCLITSAPDFFANYFCSFGFDHIFASKPFCLKEREFTPQHILHAKDKPRLASQLCRQLGFKFEESVAFGDSLSDVALFQNLSHTVSVNGDKHIKDYAKYHYTGNDLLEALNLVFF